MYATQGFYVSLYGEQSISVPQAAEWAGFEFYQDMPMLVAVAPVGTFHVPCLVAVLSPWSTVGLSVRKVIGTARHPVTGELFVALELNPNGGGQ